MSLNSSWAPNETHHAIVLERFILEGSFLGCVAYGVLLLLYIQCLAIMLADREKNRHTWVRLGYVTALFACGTIGTASGIKMAELSYIDNRNIPHGPNAFGGQFAYLPVSVMGFVAFNLAVWLQDGYLLYRFLVIWDWNWLMFIIPAILYLTSVGLSIVTMFMFANPNVNLWEDQGGLAIFTPFWAISIILNVSLTGLITARLLYLRSTVRKVLGIAHSNMYTSISALLIESAALYTVFALAYVITFALKNAAQNIVIPILTLLSSIAPMLITYRVANGRAWTSQTINLSTDIMFEPHSPNTDGRSKVFVSTSNRDPQEGSLPSATGTDVGQSVEKIATVDAIHMNRIRRYSDFEAHAV